MAYLSQPLGGDWRPYWDLNAEFQIELVVGGNVVIVLELKNIHNEYILDPPPTFSQQNNPQEYCIMLNKLQREKLGEIKELCLTAFMESGTKGGFIWLSQKHWLRKRHKPLRHKGLKPITRPERPKMRTANRSRWRYDKKGGLESGIDAMNTG